MESIFRRYPFLLALAVFAVALAAIVAWEVSNSVGAGEPLAARTVRRAAPFEAKLLPPPVVVQPEQQYAELAARPLWTPTRRPAPPAAAPSTYTPGQFVLQGVIVVGNSKTAMLKEKSNGKLHRVEAGKQLNGITVAEISPDSVTLTQGADREVLPLTVQKAAPAPAVPGAPAPPPAAPAYGFGPPLPPGVNPAPQHPAPTAATPAAAPGGGFFTAPQNPAPPAPVPGSGAPPAPTAQVTPAANPMTAEELLARRRARRAQQAQ